MLKTHFEFTNLGSELRLSGLRIAQCGKTWNSFSLQPKKWFFKSTQETSTSLVRTLLSRNFQTWIPYQNIPSIGTQSKIDLRTRKWQSREVFVQVLYQHPQLVILQTQNMSSSSTTSSEISSHLELELKWCDKVALRQTIVMWQGAKSETGLIYSLLLQALKLSGGAALVTLCEIDDLTFHSIHTVLLLLEVKLLLLFT